jgi:hypothetical protein
MATSNSELLERFLPGYRIVCRIFARYLGIDLTDFMSKAFVFFALLKSAQYLWASVQGISVGFLTSNIEVPEGDVQRAVLKWVESNQGGARSEIVAVGVPSAIATNGEWQKGSPGVISYELAFDSTVCFLRNYRVITLQRQRGKSTGGDMILLTCIGFTTQPLREFLEECVESAAVGQSRKSNGKAK